LAALLWRCQCLNLLSFIFRARVLIERYLIFKLHSHLRQLSPFSAPSHLASWNTKYRLRKRPRLDIGSGGLAPGWLIATFTRLWRHPPEPGCVTRLICLGRLAASRRTSLADQAPHSPSRRPAGPCRYYLQRTLGAGHPMARAHQPACVMTPTFRVAGQGWSHLLLRMSSYL
jgi:hypothetical protein